MEHNFENKKALSFGDLVGRNIVSRQLSNVDAQIVMSLLQGMDLFINKKLNVFPKETLDNARTNQEIANVLFELRKHWYQNTSMIDEFIKEAEINEQQVVDLLQSWKRFIQDDFIFIKAFPECAILQHTKNHQYYSILGLNSDFNEIFPSNDVKIIKATLLPFRDRIVWDGLILTSESSFNPSFAKELVEACKLARRKGFVVTSI